MEIKIEEISIDFLDQLHFIEKKCFRLEAFSKKQISCLLKDYSSISLAARVNNEIVGFMIGQIEVEKDIVVGHIITLDITPNYHRKGIGQKLIQKIEAIFKQRGIKEAYLEVREDNTAALELYIKCGFKKMAKLENYYLNGHGFHLRKTL